MFAKVATYNFIFFYAKNKLRNFLTATKSFLTKLISTLLELLETTKKQMLILGAKDLLIHIHHQKLGKHAISQLPLVAKQVSALTYNSLNDTLLVSDNQTHKIMSFNLKNGLTTQVPVGELGHVVSMDFGKRFLKQIFGFFIRIILDYLGNNLYWCDSEKQTVEVFNFNTKTRKVVLYDLGGEIPQSIALVPEEG